MADVSISIIKFSYFELLLFIVGFLVFVDLFSVESFAFSPHFAPQELTNTNLKWPWFDMKTYKPVDNGDLSAYIIAANYFSDGKVLNATLWLPEPFRERPFGTQISYGMLVDSDDNKDTGVSGIDYNYEIGSNNNTHTWNEVLEKWSPRPIADFSTMILTNQSNYKGFYEKGKGFVSLSLDLSKLFYPQKYKVLFYAEAKNKTADLLDFTNWVHIPPPQIKISTNPKSLDLYRGEGEREVEVTVNSTSGQESVVRLNTSQSGPLDIKAAPTYAHGLLSVPSYGIATTSFKLNASRAASIKPYTLFVFANSTFPKQLSGNPRGFSLTYLVASHSINEPIVNHTSITVNVHEPPSYLEKVEDQINILWSKLGSPLAFFYGIIAGISPWIYRSIRNYSKRDGNK